LEEVNSADYLGICWYQTTDVRPDRTLFRAREKPAKKKVLIDSEFRSLPALAELLFGCNPR